MQVFLRKYREGGSHNPWRYSATLVELPANVIFDNQGLGYLGLEELGRALARNPRYKEMEIYPGDGNPRRLSFKSKMQTGRLTDDELTEILKGIEQQDQHNRTKVVTDPETGATRVYTEPA